MIFNLFLFTNFAIFIGLHIFDFDPFSFHPFCHFYWITNFPFCSYTATCGILDSGGFLSTRPDYQLNDYFYPALVDLNLLSLLQNCLSVSIKLAKHLQRLLNCGQSPSLDFFVVVKSKEDSVFNIYRCHKFILAPELKQVL